MSDTRIEAVFGWEALDSRGRPTVGCAVRLAGGAVGEATVPSGASTGRHEARELRDGGVRYGGFGVTRAVDNVRGELAATARGLDASDQDALDDRLRDVDGTDDLGRLGANAVLAVSVAATLAAASAAGRPLYRPEDVDEPLRLPMPMINILSGGAHAGRVLDIQDVLVIPVGATTFAEAIEWVDRVRRATATVAGERGLATHLVADEGGLAPALTDNRAAVELVAAGIERAGFEPLAQMAIAVDVAASEFVSHGGYRLASEKRTLSTEALITELVQWTRQYPMISIEDALGEDDWAGWRSLTERAPQIQLVGDDLFVTSPERLRRGIDGGVANAVLVKPNQVGTLSQARRVVRIAHESGYRTVLSARSGETEDSWLADLSVAWCTGQLKVGSTHRSERTAKWNRLLRIEAQERAAGRDPALIPWQSPRTAVGRLPGEPERTGQGRDHG